MSPAELAGFDSIPPPIQEQIQMLHGAVDRLWDLRHAPEALTRIESKLSTLADFTTRHQTVLDELVVPWLKDMAAKTDEMHRELPKLVASVDDVTRDVAILDKRVRDLEVDLRTSGARFDSNHQQHAARFAAIEAAGSANEQRIKSLESDREVSKALARTAKKRTGGFAGTISAIVAGVVSAIAALAR